jgi:hypothetical protein
MNDVVVGLGLLDQISGIRNSISDRSRVVFAEIKVFLSKFMNRWVDLNNSSINTMRDKSRRGGSDTKSTISC